MLAEMDDEFGVSNVVNEAFGDVAKVKVKKEPVCVVFFMYHLLYSKQATCENMS